MDFLDGRLQIQTQESCSAHLRTSFFRKAHLKGIVDFEIDAFYEIAKSAMLQEEELSFGSPPDLSYLDTYGYYPSDLVGRSVAWNQEQTIADYALANLAYEMEDPDASAYLLTRSETWKNLYDPDIGFFHARNSKVNLRNCALNLLGEMNMPRKC